MTAPVAASNIYPPVQQEVARLATIAEVRAIADLLRKQESQIAKWQMEVARIAAPPFGEAARSAWLAERFREIGLSDVEIDDIGNVFGVHPGFGKDRKSTRLNSSHVSISYAVFCLKKKK